MKNLWTKIWISLATVVIMLMAGVLMVLIFLMKMFKKITARDPFHDSRQHPLNDPTAPRGA